MNKIIMVLLMGILFIVGCSDQGNLDKPNDTGKDESRIAEAEGFDFTISGTISPEEYQLSEESFSIESGKELLQVKSNWDPSGARVIFGFIDAKTNEEFWEPSQKSGVWHGTIKTSNLKPGEYFIAVKTEPEINDYDKRERNIVAHFNWK